VEDQGCKKKRVRCLGGEIARLDKMLGMGEKYREKRKVLFDKVTKGGEKRWGGG